jgi:hypothetical protein
LQLLYYFATSTVQRHYPIVVLGGDVWNAGDQFQNDLCLAVATSTVQRIALIRRHVLVEDLL